MSELQDINIIAIGKSLKKEKKYRKKNKGNKQ
jgi:hypothetical protein